MAGHLIARGHGFFKIFFLITKILTFRFNNETGDWYHSANTKFKDRRWLGHISFKSGKMELLGGQPFLGVGTPPENFEQILSLAKVKYNSICQ